MTEALAEAILCSGLLSLMMMEKRPTVIQFWVGALKNMTKKWVI